MRGVDLVAGMLDRAVEHQIPINGSVAMTHRCHLKCLHCYLGDERYEKPEGVELPTEFWASLVDQMADAGCLNLLITGGEPLLRKDFALLYERIKRKGILVTVFTNGTLVDDHIADLFLDLPPQLVEVSLYGASEAVYESVTGIPGSYRRCLAGVDALLQRGVAVGLKTVILTENVHEVQAMRTMAEARGVAFRVDPAVFPCRDGDQAPIDHRIDAREAVALEMADHKLLEASARAFERMRDAPPDESLYSCMAGLTGFHVDPRGMLYPCMMVTSGGYDLSGGRFEDGWSEVMPKFRAQGVAAGDECHVCEMRSLCGVCPAQSAMETGSPHKKAEYMCQLGAARLQAVRRLGP